MNNNIKIRQALVVAAGFASSLAISLPAQARNIRKPMYDGHRVHACAYNMNCDQKGKWFVADNFCQLIGYRQARAWNTRKGRKLSRKRASIALEFRPSGNVWRRIKTRHYFTRIKCSH